MCGANRWGTAPKRKSLAGNNKTRMGCSGSQNLSAVKPHLRQASIRPPGISPAGGRNCLAVSARGRSCCDTSRHRHRPHLAPESVFRMTSGQAAPPLMREYPKQLIFLFTQRCDLSFITTRCRNVCLCRRFVANYQTKGSASCLVSLQPYLPALSRRYLAILH